RVPVGGAKFERHLLPRRLLGAHPGHLPLCHVTTEGAYTPRSYVRIRTPSPTVFESARRSRFLSLVGPNRRLPSPSTTGKTIRWSTSTRSFSRSACASEALPCTTTSPACASLSLATFSARSPSSTVVFVHFGSFSVD